MRSLGLAILLALLLAWAMPARAEDPRELVFVFQKQKDPAKIKTHADRLASLLSDELKMPVKTLVPGDYSATVQAMVSRQADIAYVSSLPFLLARRDGGATLLLAEARKDAAGTVRTDYDSILVVAKDSPLNSIEDLKQQARDLRMAFTSATSTSGYIMAYARFIEEGMLKPKQDPRELFKSVTFAGGYTQALEQVISGQADLAAVSDYTLEGPNADVYLKPEQRAKLRILARTTGVPTHLICARAGLSDELKGKVKAALLKLASEHSDLLADVYGANAFAEVNEQQHVRKAIEAIEFTGIPIEGLAK